jgi:hypothetical protein
MLPALALRYVINKRVNPRGKGQTAVSILVMLVSLIAGLGMAYTFLGDFLAWGIDWVSGMSTALQIGIPLALTIVAVGVALADIAFDRRADNAAQFSAILAPTMLALVVAGSIGATGGNAVHDTYQRLHTQVVKMGGHS